jgi:hypothetical protein
MPDIPALLEAAAARADRRAGLDLFAALLDGDETRVSNTVHGAPRTRVLEAVFQAQLALGRFDDCEATLRRFTTCAVTDQTIERSNAVLETLWRGHRGARIIGTTYAPSERAGRANEGDVVVHYGSYPHDGRALPSRRALFRHAYLAGAVRHDIFESDEPAWGSIGAIYVLNMVDRPDRYLDTLLELSRLHAPLDRVVQVRAEHEDLVPGNRYANASASCAANHARIMRQFLDSPHAHCLVLEDDIAFGSDVSRILTDLALFFERRYEFAVCLLAASKFHELRAHDDLLMRSFQECTTASAYLVTRESAPLLLECFETGVAGIRETGDVHRFAADRYWARLMDAHPFYVFRSKFGYQKPSWSSIQSRHVFNFD